MLAAVLCALGLPAGFLLMRRIPLCPSADFLPAISVSIIIPARNEERNLPRLLSSIFDSRQTPAEIIVVDDDSADETAAVARGFGVRVLTPGPRPPGWTGKSWACYQGAQHASGGLLLFLDADLYFVRGGLDRVIASWIRAQDPTLALSLLPFHVMNAGYEHLSLFFNLLMAAGAGGFAAFTKPRLFGQSLVIAKDCYFRAGGHAAVPGVVLENLRWASGLRDHGARLLCLGGKSTLEMRMFPDGLRQMTESWSKAFTQGAGDSGRFVLLLSILWISALWSSSLLLLAPHDYGRLPLAIVYMMFVLQVAWQSHQLGNYRLLICMIYPVPLAYFCVVFAGAAWRRALGRRATWRGREV